MHDYTAGKAEYATSGLPMEGKSAGRRRAGDVARKEREFCVIGETVGQARERLRQVGKKASVLLNDKDIVLGRLRGKALEESDAGTSVEEVTEHGPMTVRPDIFVHDFTERMRRRKVGSVLVTTPGEGRYIGTLYREDIERLLEENPDLGGRT